VRPASSGCGSDGTAPEASFAELVRDVEAAEAALRGRNAQRRPRGGARPEAVQLDRGDDRNDVLRLAFTTAKAIRCSRSREWTRPIVLAGLAHDVTPGGRTVSDTRRARSRSWSRFGAMLMLPRLITPI
jgi:hypothetical protein